MASSLAFVTASITACMWPISYFALIIAYGFTTLELGLYLGNLRDYYINKLNY
jgi:nitrate reductase NapE component